MTRKGGNETSVFDDFQNRFVFRMHKFLASNRIRARRQVVQREAEGSHPPPPIHGDWNEGGSPPNLVKGPTDLVNKALCLTKPLGGLTTGRQGAWWEVWACRHVVRRAAEGSHPPKRRRLEWRGQTPQSSQGAGGFSQQGLSIEGADTPI